MPRILPPLIVVACLLGGWEAYCRLADISPLILPAPSGVVRALILNRVEIGGHTLSTISVAALGFSFSIGFAFSTSVMLHFLPWTEKGLMPVFVASQTVPLVALAPLMIL